MNKQNDFFDFETPTISTKLPILYARGERGRILEWEVEVEGSKFRTITGGQGAKKVISEWTTCKGKNTGRANSTTGDEQALKEAKAEWDKKIRRGGYWEDISDINQTKFIEPMLAYPMVSHKTDKKTGQTKIVDRREYIKLPAMVDRKYNGGRVIISSDGAYTRKGEKYHTIPHLVRAVAHLIQKFPNLVLDGEGYDHNLRFKLNELMSILRTSKNVTQALIERSEEIVKYYVYDGYGFTVNGQEITENTPCDERRMALDILLKDIPYVVVVPFFMASNMEKVYELYEGFVEDGYEGAIIRNAKSPYQHKRTEDLLKVKPEDDAEFEILDIEEAKGNWSGTGKKIWFKKPLNMVFTDGTDRFKGSFKGSQEQGAKFLRDKKMWIGRTVTVLYNGLTGIGKPNYARMDINNCIKGDR